MKRCGCRFSANNPPFPAKRLGCPVDSIIKDIWQKVNTKSDISRQQQFFLFPAGRPTGFITLNEPGLRRSSPMRHLPLCPGLFCSPYFCNLRRIVYVTKMRRHLLALLLPKLWRDAAEGAYFSFYSRLDVLRPGQIFSEIFCQIMLAFCAAICDPLAVASGVSHARRCNGWQSASSAIRA